jgi:hypothetical protein
MPTFVTQEAELASVKYADLSHSQQQTCAQMVRYLCRPRRCSWCGTAYTIASSSGIDCDDRPVDHYDFSTETGDVHVPYWVYTCLDEMASMRYRGPGWDHARVVKLETSRAPTEVVLPRRVPVYD